MITGLSPAASARPWRSCTFSLREAAISTSTSPAEVGARADHAEVEADFVQREGDVLVGLGLDLDFEFLLGHAAGQDDLLGDDGRGRQRHGHVLGAGAAFLDHPAHGLGHFVEFLDVAVGDPAALQRLDRAALQHQVAVLVTAELDQLDAG